jgi:enamidase
MSTTLIRNIGDIVTGDLDHPLADADAILLVDGVVGEVGTTQTSADNVIDANRLTLTPGLVDGHTHPVFGDFSPTQGSVGWMETYLHGGTTTIVSAGELHLPGLPMSGPEPKLYRYLAVLARRCFATYRPGGMKVEAGTMLLTPGMREKDFEELAEEGCQLVKFIFFPYDERMDEAITYRRWAREHGLIVKIHSGGVSRSGVSRPAGAAVIARLQPDIVGHATGGPIPMPFEELQETLEHTSAFLEVAYAGNPRWTRDFVRLVRERGMLERITVGSDTPSGTGTAPRAMLQTVAMIAALGDVGAAEALCLASGNTARAHGLDTGFIRPGAPADLLLMGRVTGANGRNLLESLSQGDMPGISMVFVDGVPLVRYRSLQTPPPERLATFVS